MNTALVWLLISLPGLQLSPAAAPTVTVATFAESTECERVRSMILESATTIGSQPLRCIQARIHVSSSKVAP